MRVILPEIIIFGLLLVGTGIVLLAASAIRLLERTPRSREDRLITRNRARFQRQRLRRARRTTPWTHYSRPCETSDEYEIGIERIWNGHVLNRKQIKLLPGDASEAQRLDWEGEAIYRAREHNDARVGMGGEP